MKIPYPRRREADKSLQIQFDRLFLALGQKKRNRCIKQPDLLNDGWNKDFRGYLARLQVFARITILIDKNLIGLDAKKHRTLRTIAARIIRKNQRGYRLAGGMETEHLSNLARIPLAAQAACLCSLKANTRFTQVVYLLVGKMVTVWNNAILLTICGKYLS